MVYPDAAERTFRRTIHHQNHPCYHLHYAEAIGLFRRNEPEDTFRWLHAISRSSYPYFHANDDSQFLCLHQMSLVFPPYGLEEN